MNAISRSFATAGLAAVALIAAACSSSAPTTSSSDNPSASASLSAAPSAPAGKSIEVGLICACTGVNGGEFTVAKQVAQAWAKKVNDGGGINGHPVELTVKDDATNPGNSATALKELVAAKVDVILDWTQMDAAWAKNAAAAKIPVVAGDLNNASFYTNPYFFSSGLTLDHALSAYVRTASQAGAENMGQLYCAEAPSCQEAVAPTKAAGEKAGVPVIYSAAIAATAPNFTAVCVAAKNAGVEALFVAHIIQTVARVIQDCGRQNYHPIYVTAGSAFTMQFAEGVGADDQVWTEFPIRPFWANNAQAKAMTDAIDAYDSSIRQNKDYFTVGATASWTGGLLIEKAIGAAGLGAEEEPTAAKIYDGLNSIKDETLDGWSPPLTFTAGENHSTDCWFVGKTQNGKPELQNDGKLTCSDGTTK